MDLMRSVPMCPLEMLPPNMDTLSEPLRDPLTIGVGDPSVLDPPSILVHTPPSATLIAPSITRPDGPVPSVLSPLFGVGGTELDPSTLNDRDHWGVPPFLLSVFRWLCFTDFAQVRITSEV